jgi:hypothetical protein
MSGIRSSRFYNDPAIGEAMNNIAQMFAPPGSADLANYANANAKREEAARLAKAFDYTTDPTYSREIADRMSYALNGNANNTFYSVDQGNRTTLDKQRLANEGALAQLYASPVQVDENATVYVPTQHSRNSGLGPVLTGQTSAAQGEKVVRADGSMIMGPEKPLSETEWSAQQQQRLLQSGMLTDQALLDTIMGEQTPVQAVGPNGEPVFMSPGSAVREGAPAYVNKGAQAKPQNAVALMPDRKTRVPAIQDPDGKWVHAQTGQPLPDGIEIFDLPKAEGSAADVGFAPTTANQTSANNQEAEITRTLNLLDIYEGALDNNPGALGLAGLVRGTAQNAVATATDLAKAFGGTAPEVAAAADDLRAGLQGVAPDLFDPSIPEIAFLQGTLAYSLARTENPSGEVSRQAYERALERVRGGGMLANTQSAKAAVGALRKVVGTQLDAVRTLRAPGAGRTDTTYQPPQGEAGIPTVSSPEEAMSLPSGTRFRDPEGNIRVRP